MVGFSVVAGMLALLAGFGEFYGLSLPLFAIALIVIGLVMLIKPLLERNSTPTVGEDWCLWAEGTGEDSKHCAWTSCRALIRSTSI